MGKKLEPINLLKIVVAVILAVGAMFLLLYNYGWSFPAIMIWGGAYFGGGILGTIRSKPTSRTKRG